MYVYVVWGNMGGDILGMLFSCAYTPVALVHSTDGGPWIHRRVPGEHRDTGGKCLKQRRAMMIESSTF
jgi:hypothetical protein